MHPIISVSNVTKKYASGLEALKGVSLEIERGEIFALLGPNGAGKTTLISIICGIVNASGGSVTVDGHDIIEDYRAARSLIGLVPQELHTDAFENGVGDRQLQPRPVRQAAKNPRISNKVLKDLSLWDKKEQPDRHAVRRHEAAGDDRQGAVARAADPVPRRADRRASTSNCARACGKWCATLRATGVTIILTTHYIEEAEEMADRIGVINKGEIILVEDKAELDAKARARSS